MSDVKDITIENSAFSLTIHWNSQAVVTQLCIMAACVLCLLFVDNVALRRLAIVFLVIDIISVVFGLFVIDRKPKEKSSSATPQESSNKEDTQVEEIQVEKPKGSHSSTTSTTCTITNRLAIATPKEHSASKTAEKSQEVDEIPQEIAPTVIPADIQSALADFFDMDYDEEDD